MQFTFFMKYENVAHIIEMLYEVTGIPTNQQIIWFNHKELDDYHGIHQYGIENGSVLKIIFHY